jgi:transglutaminase-like putative cysteine protease
MIISQVPTDGSPRSTCDLMYVMVERYHTDMLPYVHLGVWDIFELIKNIPFRNDPVEVETLQRPFYTMSESGPGGDCDDKSIALASWCRCCMIPFRFKVVRRFDMSDLHHVYTEMYYSKKWIHADPTYSFNSLGREREAYAEYVIM